MYLVHLKIIMGKKLYFKIEILYIFLVLLEGFKDRMKNIIFCNLIN